MLLDKQQAAARLLELEDALILCHRNPDGDTLGSGFALCRALLALGRRARVFCHSPEFRRLSLTLESSRGPMYLETRSSWVTGT